MLKKFIGWYSDQLKAMPAKLDAAAKKREEVRIKFSNLHCPKCDSKNVKTLKPSLIKKAGEGSFAFLTLGIAPRTKDLNVCKNCGLSWESR